MAVKRLVQFLSTKTFKQVSQTGSLNQPASLALFKAGEDDPSYWYGPFSDAALGGSSQIKIDYVEEEINQKLFFTPKKQGVVDHRYCKNPALECPTEDTTPVYFKTKVLDIQGILTDTISEEQKQSKQEDRLVTSGFASLMSKEFNPALDLEDFDALEYRVRVLDGKVWVANVQSYTDFNGEMYQAIFTGSKDWTSVVIPFTNFVYTVRGRATEEPQDFERNDVFKIGFLQADRALGPFHLQVESINAISLERMSHDARFTAKQFQHSKELKFDINTSNIKSSDKKFYPIVKY